ncbi:hypothetical protein [Cephaloticoccus primus]|nr:hypothetical protein [Cephaloticoccus primus]
MRSVVDSALGAAQTKPHFMQTAVLYVFGFSFWRFFYRAAAHVGCPNA